MDAYFGAHRNCKQGLCFDPEPMMTLHRNQHSVPNFNCSPSCIVHQSPASTPQPPALHRLCGEQRVHDECWRCVEAGGGEPELCIKVQAHKTSGWVQCTLGFEDGTENHIQPQDFDNSQKPLSQQVGSLADHQQGIHVFCCEET